MLLRSSDTSETSLDNGCYHINPSQISADGFKGVLLHFIDDFTHHIASFASVYKWKWQEALCTREQSKFQTYTDCHLCLKNVKMDLSYYSSKKKKKVFGIDNIIYSLQITLHKTFIKIHVGDVFVQFWSHFYKEDKGLPILNTSDLWEMSIWKLESLQSLTQKKVSDPLRDLVHSSTTAAEVSYGSHISKAYYYISSGVEVWHYNETSRAIYATAGALEFISELMKKDNWSWHLHHTSHHSKIIKKEERTTRLCWDWLLLSYLHSFRRLRLKSHIWAHLSGICLQHTVPVCRNLVCREWFSWGGCKPCNLHPSWIPVGVLAVNRSSSSIWTLNHKPSQWTHTACIRWRS